MEQVRLDRFDIAEPVSGSALLHAEMKIPAIAGAVVTSDNGILALESAWRALETQCPDTVLFQSFDWCANHLRFSRTMKESGDAFRPRVITLYKCGMLVGLLPLCLQSKGRMKVLTGFSEPFQQYTEILLLPSVDKVEARKAIQKVLETAGADYFHFGQVRQDGMLAKLLDGLVPTSGESEAAPFVTLSDFSDYDTYLKTIRTKTRKNLRNARNRLERDGAVTHFLSRGGKVMEEVVQRTFEGREAWLERMGITSRAFRDENFKAFLERFSNPNIASGVDTVAMSLKQGETAISDQWGFVYHGRYYAFMATWNLDFEAVSPGRIHLGEVIKACFDEGFTTADFMIPASSYKLTWAENAAPVRDYVLALSLSGRIYTGLWLNLLRPVSKRLFFKLPAGLRGVLVRKVLPSVE